MVMAHEKAKKVPCDKAEQEAALFERLGTPMNRNPPVFEARPRKSLIATPTC